MSKFDGQGYERIEAETGLDKRDLVDALFAADALGIIEGTDAYEERRKT